jgi:hypothetical protein
LSTPPKNGGAKLLKSPLPCCRCGLLLGSFTGNLSAPLPVGLAKRKLPPVGGMGVRMLIRGMAACGCAPGVCGTNTTRPGSISTLVGRRLWRSRRSAVMLMAIICGSPRAGFLASSEFSARNAGLVPSADPLIFWRNVGGSLSLRGLLTGYAGSGVVSTLGTLGSPSPRPGPWEPPNPPILPAAPLLPLRAKVPMISRCVLSAAPTTTGPLGPGLAS